MLYTQIPSSQEIPLLKFLVVVQRPKRDLCVCAHGKFGVIHSGYCGNEVILSMKQDHFNAFWKLFSCLPNFKSFPF